MTKVTAGSSVLLSQGRLLDPSQNVDEKVDILFKDGKVLAIGKTGELNSKAKSLNAEVIELKNKIIAPGFVDLNARLASPGQEPLESIDSATLAAAAGGFTTIVCSPNIHPINDNAFTTDFLIRHVKEKAHVRIFPMGTATLAREGEKLAEIGSMARAGVVAVGDDGKSIMNSYLMRKALEYVQAFDMPIFSFPQDQQLVGKGMMDEGIYSSRLGIRGIPAAAEEIMVCRDIALQEHTGGRLHFSSISSRGALRAIRDAKSRGLQISAETNPQYYSLSADMISSYDANYKCFPPLRYEDDVDAIVEAMADGTIDCVATMHTPQSEVSKDLVFDYASSGMINFETAFPLGLRLVHQKRLSLQRLIELFSCNPAKVLRKKEIGTLKIGANADAVVIDPERKFTYTRACILTAAKNSPFVGEQFEGMVCKTFVNGTLVFERDAKK